MHLHKRVCLYFHSLRLKISFGKCVRVVMLVTISVQRMITNPECYQSQMAKNLRLY